MEKQYHTIIIGSGHNALVAAAYLAKAGKSVLILEKNDYIGGATVSAKVFPEYEAFLSRFAYLVSLFPNKIAADLGLSLNLLTRAVASYTPYFNGNETKGLILSNVNEKQSEDAIKELGDDLEGYQQFLEETRQFAAMTWDSLLSPLASKSDWKEKFSEHPSLWEAFVERPIGEYMEQRALTDILRGVLLTDAKIGAYTHAHDDTLLQNRTFLYHIIGNGTGEWRVPQGGMGSLVTALKNLIEKLGVRCLTEIQISSIDKSADRFVVETTQDTFTSSYLLLNAAPVSLMNVFTEPIRHHWAIDKQSKEGTAFKINILLKSLPLLKDKQIKPEEAFCGTFHICQSYTQQKEAFEKVSIGLLPDWLPCEMYCHTLTDPSILSEELQNKGYHTFTVFCLDLPYSLFVGQNEPMKEKVLALFYKSINQFLEKPIQEYIAQNLDGSLCIEYKSALDLEKEVGLPKGNIFQTDLEWFFAESEAEIGQWGVETGVDRLYLCGSSAKRGGAVSGIPGHNAAQKVLSNL